MFYFCKYMSKHLLGLFVRVTYCACVCVWMALGAYVTVQMDRSEDNVMELVLSIQFFRFWSSNKLMFPDSFSNCLCPLSHLISSDVVINQHGMGQVMLIQPLVCQRTYGQADHGSFCRKGHSVLFAEGSRICPHQGMLAYIALLYGICRW